MAVILGGISVVQQTNFGPDRKISGNRKRDVAPGNSDANLVSQGKTVAGTSQVPGGWLWRRLKAVSITGRAVANLYRYC